MKVFISQPMRGKSSEEIQSERSKIIKYIIDNYQVLKPIEVIDSVIKDYYNYSRLQCLSKSISMLDKADIVVFAHGWTNNIGCIAENTIARGYGKLVIDLNYTNID